MPETSEKYKQFIDALVPNHGKKLVDDARLIIPFYDVYNNLIAVSGRALETNDKTLRYITIRTTDSEDKLVFGMDRMSVHFINYAPINLSAALITSAGKTFLRQLSSSHLSYLKFL